MSLYELHHGDCLAGLRTLADLSVDVTITDPPYEAEAHELGKRQNPTRGRHGKPEPRVVDDGISFCAMTEELRCGVAREIDRVSMTAALVFCQAEGIHLWRAAFAEGELTYRRAIPWVKPDAMPSLHGRWPGQAFEVLLLFVRPGAKVPVGGKSRYYECTRERGETRAHPTTKPLELMRQIVADFTRPNELVLDPFAGSGSTGVAALMLGRRFVGWELDQNYYDIARRRLNGDEAQPRPEQPSLFGAMP